MFSFYLIFPRFPKAVDFTEFISNINIRFGLLPALKFIPTDPAPATKT